MTHELARELASISGDLNRRLGLLVDRAGLELLGLHGVTPGRYRADPPSLEVPEFLVLARRPGGEIPGRDR